MHAQRRNSFSKGRWRPSRKGRWSSKLIPCLACTVVTIWFLSIRSLRRLGGVSNEGEDSNMDPDEPPEGRNVPIGVWSPGEAPEGLEDYPCAENSENNTAICSVPCLGLSCMNAWFSCETNVWCTDIIVGNRVARLKHARTGMAYDASEELLEEVGLPTLTIDVTGKSPPRRRIYMIVSASRSRGDLFAHFLTNVAGPTHVRRIYHVLDVDPPERLKYQFFVGDEGTELPPLSMDSVRVVFVYGDPAAALVEEYGGELCEALQGDCARWWAPGGLEALATAGGDPVGLSRLYRAYLAPGGRLNYPVVAINAEKMWDETEAVVAALGLPRTMGPSLEALAPQWRRLRRRNEAERFDSWIIREIRLVYKLDLMPMVLRMPAVKVIDGSEEDDDQEAGAPPAERSQAPPLET